MERAFSYIVFVVMTGLVVTPAFRDPPYDSFPFSDFPMFSRGRPDPMLNLVHALGVNDEGEREPLPPLISAGNEEVLQSMLIIHQGLYGSDPAAFCEEIAARVASSSDHENIEAVELVTSRFDCVAYFEGDTTPVARHTHRRCEVSR